MDRSDCFERLAPLSTYDISPTRGFVPKNDPVRELPEAFASWEAVIADISAHIRSRSFRRILLEQPTFARPELKTPEQEERALLLLSMCASAWVWGGVDPDFKVPRQIAVPLCGLAKKMNRVPILHYASIALNNWRRVDQSKPLSADNATTQLQFLGGVDEDWFLIGSVAVELAGAPLLADLRRATIASHDANDIDLAQLVATLAAGVSPMVETLDEITEWCDPHVYCLRVRPFFAGWPDPGVVYEGVDTTPCSYVGGSAGQSALIQAIDAGLCVAHEPASVRNYLKGLRPYMPAPHRRFVTDIERTSRIRERAGNGTRQLCEAYNDAVSQIEQFRRRHIRLAGAFIGRASKKGGSVLGTGGTDYADFLSSARKSTSEARL